MNTVQTRIALDILKEKIKDDLKSILKSNDLVEFLIMFDDENIKQVKIIIPYEEREESILNQALDTVTNLKQFGYRTTAITANKKTGLELDLWMLKTI